VLGRVGTGMTPVAVHVDSELDRPLFSSDEIRKTMASVPLSERTAAEMRDEVYSKRMTEQTYKKLLEHGLAALETHNGVVLDATFSSRANRKSLHDACAKAGVHLQVIELNVDPATIRARLSARDKSAGEISDARREDFEKLTAAYDPPSELAQDLIKISTANAVSDSVRTIVLQLAEKQSATTYRRSLSSPTPALVRQSGLRLHEFAGG